MFRILRGRRQRHVHDGTMLRKKRSAIGMDEGRAIGREQLRWNRVRHLQALNFAQITGGPDMMLTPGCVSMSATLPPPDPAPSSQAANGDDEGAAAAMYTQTVWGGMVEDCALE